LAAAHVFIASLSVSCGPRGTMEEGPFVLEANSSNGFYEREQIGMTVDDDVIGGHLTGFLEASGCTVEVRVCDKVDGDEECETEFFGFVEGEDLWEIDADDNDMFEHWLLDFEPCYEDAGEFAARPFSCEDIGCYRANHAFYVDLESACHSRLEIMVEVQYRDSYAHPERMMEACSYMLY